MMGKKALVKQLEDLNASRQNHYNAGEVQYIPVVTTEGKPAASQRRFSAFFSIYVWP
jgi:hypothetical protein